ncbi:Unannotated [Lentimonas sp. CC19]|nr:Unannotated [Lentimonas sp. CC4]CAA6686932.1 Unannotated [Lentimonas sp. CC6]CAA6690115.1 Unannotated [Lentimonas sp. CC19]CAA6690923.1 Unannotated [Lentimonas sp. CC10]CAA7070725.1 Unannotated [Lentimonas sp. CC11]CAA7169252.1 Unannotated [Lentimonas sp. CC21]CAA7180350.1 Unannotated [Lentimonas sp. CC8]
MNTTKYIQAHRDHPESSRRVRSGRGNAIGFVMSEKMGPPIAHESKMERSSIWHSESMED